MRTIAPGATIGILGGGQLGRMMALAAAQLGYSAHVYAPEPREASVAAQVSAAYTQGAMTTKPRWPPLRAKWRW
jgi:5-(carboxyamino)imidazole ribonucleotide synthase